MDGSAIAALLGALIGALAGVLGQIATAAYTNRTDRRRLAVETGFREWQQLLEHLKTLRNVEGEMFPPVLFVHFNNELLRAIDSRDGLSVEKYRALTRRRDEIRDVIREDNERRRKEKANG